MSFSIKEEENTILQGKSKMAEGLDKGRTKVVHIREIPKRKGKT